MKKTDGTGVTLGADVPYCIMRGTALAEGIGEKLTRLPAMPKCHLLIAKPPISVSTKLVYEKLDALAIVDHPDIDGIIEGLKDRDLIRVAGSMGNVLQNVTETEYPVITQIKEKMIKGGAINAMMSGSGPTVFGFSKSEVWQRRRRNRFDSWDLQDRFTRQPFTMYERTGGAMNGSRFRSRNE